MKLRTSERRLKLCVDFQICECFFLLTSLYLTLPPCVAGRNLLFQQELSKIFVCLFGTGLGLLYCITPTEAGVSFDIKTHQSYL